MGPRILTIYIRAMRYTGNLNSIKNHIKQDLLLIIVLVRLTELSKLLTLCLTAVKNMLSSTVKRYMRDPVKTYSGEILDKLIAKDFNATSLSTYDFSTLYTTLPQNLIKDKLFDLIERAYQREGSPYLACNDRNAFFTSEKPKKYHA